MGNEKNQMWFASNKEVRRMIEIEILHIIMKKLEQYEITVSEYDNLEGLICQKVKMMS